MSASRECLCSLCLFLPAPALAFLSLSPFPLHQLGLSYKINGFSQDRIKKKKQRRSVSWWDLVRIETVKDVAICSVTVVDHVVNLLTETEKCVKEECAERSRSHACFFFFFFFF